MKRRDFLKIFPTAAAVTSLPFAVSGAKAEALLPETVEHRLTNKAFDPKNSYGNAVMFTDDSEFDRALKLIIDNARHFIPRGRKIQIIYYPLGSSGTIDPYCETGSVAWKYSPKLYKNPNRLGVITL